MSTSDVWTLVVAIGAAVISLGSLIVAERARRVVTSAHALNQRRDREERERREGDQLGRARFVTVGMLRTGVFSACVVNSAPDTVADVRIESVERVDRPDLRVEPNPYYANVQHRWPFLRATEHGAYAVILVDEHGQRREEAEDPDGGTWRIVATFTDAQGQRWRRTSREEPERIDR